FRCADCDSRELLCSACMVEQHRCSPLHRIKRWNGMYFEEESLANIGMVLDVGHAPSGC
ncbi:hypothetical protein M422DRAFT_78561, partial [Sphaerobolus stellatus SS14]